jgi:hypothetical protein
VAVRWEYTQSACDVVQLAELCNHFAAHRWEPVAVVEADPGVELPAIVGYDLGPRAVRQAVRPYVVLFRRRSRLDEED